jgi:hypothetical protein
VTDATRRDRRAERARRQRRLVAIGGSVLLVVAIGATVFLVGFRDDDSPAARSPGSGTTATRATTTTSAPPSSEPASSVPPETTAAPASTTPPPLDGAPAENVNAPGAGCGGDNQPAIAGAWEATAPTDPVDGGTVDLALRQQDGTSVAGLPVTAVVTGPGGRTYPSSPVPVAALRSDATVKFPDDFPGAGPSRLDDSPGFYGVRWQTVGGGSLACAGFPVR